MAGRRDYRRFNAAVDGVLAYSERHQYMPLPDVLFCATCGGHAQNIVHACPVVIRVGKVSMPCGQPLPCRAHSTPERNTK